MVMEQDITNQKSAMQHKYDGKPKMEYRFGGEALAIARGIMDRFTKADFAKIHP